MLLADHTSKMHAAVAGWRYAPSDVERALYDQVDVELFLATAPKSRGKLQPLSRPWLPDAKKVAPPVLTPQTRARLRGWADRVLRRT